MVDPSRTYRRNHGLFQRMTKVRHITGGSHVLQEKWSKYLSLSIVLHISKLCRCYVVGLVVQMRRAERVQSQS